MNSDDKAGMARIRALPPEQRRLLALRLKQGSGRSVTPPITRRGDRGRAPLAPEQERLWLIDQMVPGASAFNISYSKVLTGAVDMPALGKALDEIVRRHESLRTTIEWEVDGPVQRIHEPGDFPVPLKFEDLSDLSAARQREQLIARASAFCNAPFDLEAGPLMRAGVIKCDNSNHVLLVTIHHIMTDNISMRILDRELFALYEAFLRGDSSPLEELPVQYGDFAAWQHEYLQRGRLEKLLRYWEHQLEGAPLVLELPTDRPRPPVQSLRGERRYFDIPRGLRDRLMAIAETERASPFMFYLAVFGMLLHRYSGQDCFLIGCPFANRSRSEIQGLIGYLLNPVPMRIDLDEDPSFRQLLGRIRQAAYGAYENHDLPFVELLNQLDPAVDLSRNPVFQNSFIYLDAHDEQDESSGPAVFSNRDIEFQGSRFDLTLVITQSSAAGVGFFEYSSDLWDRASIDRMISHLQQCMEAVATNPDARIADVPLLSKDERQLVLGEWNFTDRPYPASCLHELFESQAARCPDAVAVVFQGAQLSYRDLNARCNILANRLRERGVSGETLVGIFAERSLERVIGVLAVLKAGGAYVPLDPDYPPARLTMILEDTRLAVLLVQPGLREKLPPYDGRMIELGDAGDKTDASLQSNPGLPSDPHNLAYVMYTSGSTGRPKGVCIEHGSLVNLICSMRAHPGMDERDVLVSVTTLSFDISGLEMYLPLLVGARLVVASREEAMDGIRLAALLESVGATVLQGTPATWRLLLESGWQGHRGLKALCGGETMPAKLGLELLDRVGSLYNLYGPTETTVWSTLERVDRESFGSTVSVGRPIANTRVYILDRNLDPVPVGVPGELYIGGAGVARGYWEREQLTAERFIEDPFANGPGNRLYRTGDVARWLADGRLEHLGRTDHQVKLRGYRIEPGEVEATLEQHSGVNQAIVMVRESGAIESLVAYVLGPERDARILDAHVRKQLPGYMVPTAWAFLDALPLTPNGKINRQALPEPGDSELGRADEFAAPRNDLDETLCRIWSEVLDIAPIGIHDNFFGMGGHSLMAVQVINRLRAKLKVELSMTSLFKHPTVAELAAHIETMQWLDQKQHGDTEEHEILVF